VCARGGSKGVPNKNVRLVASKPLLVYTLEQAVACGAFERIAFSSDDADYRALAGKAGADFLIERPTELATDTAGKIDVIRHCVLCAEQMAGNRFDIIIDLDCTSPLRLPSDILACIELLQSTRAGNVITAAPARRSPYFNLIERAADGSIGLAKSPARSVLRRQDAPACYDMNASIYVWRRDALFDRNGLFHADTQLYVMPEERSIDVDSELDFRVVSMLLEDRRRGL
jgi:N-acylneuraminate cytidylyltransferase/CMP-N,N'-diacetyllegionaminic acid synthase